MGASGISSKGTVLAVSGTNIALVYSVGGPSISKDAPETTDLSDSWRTFSPSAVRDGGEITLGVRFLPTNSTQAVTTGLLYHLSNEVTPSCTITWPDGTAYSFSAIVTGFDVSADLDSALDASVTMKVTGTPTLA